MTSPTDQFTRNAFVDRVMKLIPDDPLTQSQYMYYLTIITFAGLGGYAAYAWWTVFTAFKASSLFSGLFMSAIAVMSLFGLKQVRNNYFVLKQLYAMKPKQTEAVAAPLIESKDEMMKGFEGEKK